MDAQYQRCTYGNGATILFFKVLRLAYGHTYGRTDSHVRNNFLEDGLPNFLRHGVPLARHRRVGAPLLSRSSFFGGWGLNYNVNVNVNVYVSIGIMRQCKLSNSQAHTFIFPCT